MSWPGPYGAPDGVLAGKSGRKNGGGSGALGIGGSWTSGGWLPPGLTIGPNGDGVTVTGGSGAAYCGFILCIS